jgi:hypothetical protein
MKATRPFSETYWRNDYPAETTVNSSLLSGSRSCMPAEFYNVEPCLVEVYGDG